MAKVKFSESRKKEKKANIRDINVVGDEKKAQAIIERMSYLSQKIAEEYPENTNLFDDYENLDGSPEKL